MWLPNPIACDVCKTVKQPSNNWYYALMQANAPAEDNAFFQIWPWDYPAEDRSKPYIHLCGKACATRKLNEFMEPVKAESVPAPAPEQADQDSTGNQP